MEKPERPYDDQAERLRWHREEVVKMTQEQYAAEIGMKRSRYSLWETGDFQLSMPGARALRKRWGLSLDFMVEGIPDTLPMTLRNAWLERPSVNISKKSMV